MTQEQQQRLFNQLKSGETTIEELLHPEKKLADFKAEDLYVDILESGFPTLDEYLFLKQKQGELVLVGGRPSNGKTALLCQVALYASQKVPVHLFSLEMGVMPIRTRLLASHMGVSATAIQQRRVNAKTMAKAIMDMGKYNYFVDDRGGLTVHQICDAARTLHKREGTALIAIDYLQLIRVQRGHTRDQEIGDISQALKELAKELQVPVLVGCQLNRMLATRGATSGNYKPILSDLRESGRIEQDADIVVLVHRPDLFPPYERKGEVDVLVVKNRNGSVGDIVMEFKQDQTKFIDRGFTL